MSAAVITAVSTTVTFVGFGVAGGGPTVSDRAGELRLTDTMFGSVIKNNRSLSSQPISLLAIASICATLKFLNLSRANSRRTIRIENVAICASVHCHCVYHSAIGSQPLPRPRNKEQ